VRQVLPSSYTERQPPIIRSYNAILVKDAQEQSDRHVLL
jgi:hypothetical protein